MWKLYLQVAIYIAVILAGIAWFSSAQQKQYEKKTYEHCKQYEIYPEAQTDRIPSACLPQYYRARVQ